MDFIFYKLFIVPGDSPYFRIIVCGYCEKEQIAVRQKGGDHGDDNKSALFIVWIVRIFRHGIYAVCIPVYPVFVFADRICQSEDIAAFHSAEHMAINAYEKLQRVPTLEEIKNFSRFSRYCGSRFIFSRICSFLMLCFSIAFLSMKYNLLYLISIGIIIVFLIASTKYGLLNFLQIFVTNKPSDKELTVAIEGLKRFEIMEDFFESEKDSPITQLLLNLSMDEE